MQRNCRELQETFSEIIYQVAGVNSAFCWGILRRKAILLLPKNRLVDREKIKFGLLFFCTEYVENRFKCKTGFVVPFGN